MQLASGKEESYVNGIPISWPIGAPPAAKLCHSCHSSTALLFCPNHSAFLCLNCDAKVHHGRGAAGHHQRVPVCELCELAPAAVTCKADAASLCVHCDAEIHSANPLSRRHERVPVAPLTAANKPAQAPAPLVIGGFFDVGDFLVPTVEDEALWMDMDQKSKLALCPNEIESEDFFFPDFDPVIDLDLPDHPVAMIFKQETISCSDGVVPISSFEALDNKSFNTDFDEPYLPIYNNPPTSVWPRSEAPLSSLQKPISEPATQQVLGTGREAKVMRYREKKKNRRFDKTVRYASRKAYAETRPRIKGRFAKRNDPDIFSDLLFEAYVADYAGYGVVPSF